MVKRLVMIMMMMMTRLCAGHDASQDKDTGRRSCQNTPVCRPQHDPRNPGTRHQKYFPKKASVMQH